MGARFPVSYNPEVKVNGVLYNSSSALGNRISVTLSGYQWSVMTCTAVATAGTGYKFIGWEFLSECPDGWGGSTAATLSASETGTPQDSIDGYQLYIVGCFESTGGGGGDDEDSAVQVITQSDPPGVGLTTGDDLKIGKVGSTAAFHLTAEPRDRTQYAFEKWTNGANVYRGKSIDVSFVLKSGYTPSNPEVYVFYAHFRRRTGLIVRSAASGVILRGTGNKILRDE